MKKQLVPLLGVAFMFAAADYVAGQSTFTGGGDGATWNDAANWDAGLPASVNANIGGGFDVNLVTDQTIGELDLVGDQNPGTATLNHSAGTLTGGGWAKIGGGPDGGGGGATDGTYNLSGSASVGGYSDMFVGFRGGTGALNLSDNASVNLSSNFRLAAEQAGSTGSLTVADNASLNTDNFNMGGDTSTATVSQTGGNVTSNTWVAIANFGTGGNATYDISAGSVAANNGNFAVGQEGTGALNVSGTAVVSQATETINKFVVGGVNDNGFVQDGTGTLSISGSSASISAADFEVAATATSAGTLSWVADSGGITSIVSADNAEFGPGTSTLSLDLTADANSSVSGTEYLLIDNSAAVLGTFSGLAEGATVDLGGGNSGTISYVGGLDGFDVVVTAGMGGGLTGDFDNDGDVDADDIDFYSGNIGQPATGALAQLDFDGDGNVTLADHQFHIENYVQTSNGETGTFVGDVNLDGTVNVLGDAFTLVGSLGTASGAGWADGDLNADGAVNVLGDAFPLVGNLGSSNAGSAAPAASAVPEPGGLSLLALLALGSSTLRRKIT